MTPRRTCFWRNGAKMRGRNCVILAAVQSTDILNSLGPPIRRVLVGKKLPKVRHQGVVFSGNLPAGHCQVSRGWRWDDGRERLTA